MNEEDKKIIDNLVGTNAEAPISVSATIYYRGAAITFTKRDPATKILPLLQSQMDAVDWAIDAKGSKGSWNKQTNDEIDKVSSLTNKPATANPSAPEIDKNTCPHAHVTLKQSSGKNKPENKGRYYNTCLDCGSFISWQ